MSDSHYYFSFVVEEVKIVLGWYRKCIELLCQEVHAFRNLLLVHRIVFALLTGHALDHYANALFSFDFIMVHKVIVNRVHFAA